MFIYKITVKPINKIYIGFDTKSEYKKSRWKAHCISAFKNNSQLKIHSAMREHGLENCYYEVIDRNYKTIGQLALAEIDYIEKYNSFRKGLNSSPGGDGLGYKNLSQLSEDELQAIKSKLGEHFTNLNYKRWFGKSSEQKKSMVEHLHTETARKKRSDTLKEFYDANPDARKEKGKGILEWQKNNKEKLKLNNKKNGQLGADKVSKKILVEFPDGNMLHYKSKSDFRRNTGMWIKTIIDKTNKGMDHNGYKAWEI